MNALKRQKKARREAGFLLPFQEYFNNYLSYFTVNVKL